MKLVTLETPSDVTGFEESKKLADQKAHEELGDSMCLSWFNKDTGVESPHQEQESMPSVDPDLPYFKQYAETRGAELEVAVDDGRYVFTYISNEEAGKRTTIHP